MVKWTFLCQGNVIHIFRELKLTNTMKFDGTYLINLVLLKNIKVTGGVGGSGGQKQVMLFLKISLGCKI